MIIAKYPSNPENKKKFEIKVEKIEEFLNIKK